MDTILIVLLAIFVIVILFGIAGFAQMLHQQGVAQQKSQRTSEA